MRVTRYVPSPPGPLYPLPNVARAGEAYVADWCRQITTSVADALHTRATHTGYRLNLCGDMPVPHLLHTTCTIDGHPVVVAVVWDDPWHESRFALTVDGAPVPIDSSAPAASTAVLAHAAWQAILASPTAAAAR